MEISEYIKRTRVTYQNFSDIAKDYSHVGSFAYWPSALERKNGRLPSNDYDAEQYYQRAIGDSQFFNQYLAGHLTKGVVFLGYNFGIKIAEAKSKSIEQMAQDHKVAPFTNQHNPSQTGKSIFPYFSPDSPVCGAYCTDFLKFLPKGSHSGQYEMTGAPTPVATDLDDYIEEHPDMIAANIDGLETELKKGLGVPDVFILVLMHAKLVSFIPLLKKRFPNALIYSKYPHYRAFTTGYEDFPAMMKKPVQELTASITDYIKNLREDAL